MNTTSDLICGLGSNSVEHCLDHVTHLKRNILLIIQPVNTSSFSFCYLKPGTTPELLLLGGCDSGAAWLICTARISSATPTSCPAYGILLDSPNLKCEREREREFKTANKRFYLGLPACPRGFTWVWCPWRSAWPFPRQHRHGSIGDIPCHPSACPPELWKEPVPQSYGKSSCSTVICILFQLFLPPKHMLCLLWLWERLRNTKKGSHWVISFSAASKPVFSHYSVSSCPSEYRRKWRWKPIIFTNI